MVEQSDRREQQEKIDQLNIPYEPRVMKVITTGKSGATVHLVRIHKDNRRVPAILKMERNVQSENEASLHHEARILAENNSCDKYIPNILYANQIGLINIILYEFVGKNDSYTLNEVLNDEKVEHLPFFSKAIATYLSTWNLQHQEEWMYPQELLKQTLGKRDDRKLLDAFHSIGIDTNHTYLMHDGVRLPNPAKYLMEDHLWGYDEIDCLLATSHGDFHGDNIILYKNGFAVIDFAELQSKTNVFYDDKYLEIHLLMDYFSFETKEQQVYWNRFCNILPAGLLNKTMQIPYGQGHLILHHVLTTIRRERLSSLENHLDEEVLLRLEPSYFLAGVSAGLNFMRKHPNPKKKFAAFLYAAHHLKQVLEHEILQLEETGDRVFPINWPFIHTKSFLHEPNHKQQAIRALIESENIEIAVQPIVNLITGEVESVELLSRDAQRKLSPIELFHEARKIGMLEKLTSITCDKFIETGRLLETLPLKHVFVNLESDLSMPGLEMAMSKLNEIKQDVVIEFTEHEEKTRFKKYWRSILHGEGFKLALDDIGEGKSDLTDINGIKPDIIKIVLANLDLHYPDKLRKRGVIAKTFHNSQFIVEQIEVWEDLDRCINLGLQYGQGYYFHRPVIIKKTKNILEEWEKGFQYLLVERSEKN